MFWSKAQKMKPRFKIGKWYFYLGLARKISMGFGNKVLYISIGYVNE